MIYREFHILIFLRHCFADIILYETVGVADEIHFYFNFKLQCRKCPITEVFSGLLLKVSCIIRRFDEILKYEFIYFLNKSSLNIIVTNSLQIIFSVGYTDEANLDVIPLLPEISDVTQDGLPSSTDSHAQRS